MAEYFRLHGFVINPFCSVQKNIYFYRQTEFGRLKLPYHLGHFFVEFGVILQISRQVGPESINISQLHPINVLIIVTVDKFLEVWNSYKSLQHFFCAEFYTGQVYVDMSFYSPAAKFLHSGPILE